MSKPTDHDVDLSVAAMLRFGVTLAAIVVLVGGVMSLRHPWTAIPDYSTFKAGGSALRTVTGIYHGLVHLDAKSIIQFGLVLLIATPVARVVFCIIGFARQRDRLYVAISSLVLLILLYSLTKGGH